MACREIGRKGEEMQEYMERIVWETADDIKLSVPYIKICRGLTKIDMHNFFLNYFWLVLRSVLLFERLPDCQFENLNISVLRRCMETDKLNCLL